MKKSNPAGIIFDLDGTLYLGNHPLPHAVEICAELRRRAIKLAFVSNKPLESRLDYAAKLTRLGIRASSQEIVTSAFVLGTYLKEHHPDLNYFVLGEGYLAEELTNQGLHILQDLPSQDAWQVIDPQGIDAVIVSFDRTFDYRKLNIAYQALSRGAHFFATNTDKACPMPGGAIPDAGAIIAALERITGRQVELVAGKPSPLILDAVTKTLGIPPEECLLVGDRLETDILMGINAGMTTALVLTGVSQRQHLHRSTVQPDYVLATLSDLMEILE